MFRDWAGRPVSWLIILHLNPFALAHQWLSCAIGGHSVDVHLAGANHPVHMDQAGICTQRRQLLRIHLLAVDDAVQVLGGMPGTPVPGQRNRSTSRLSVQIGWAARVLL